MERGSWGGEKRLDIGRLGSGTLVFCFSQKDHSRLSCPDSDSNKLIGLDGKQGRTGPGQAKRVLRKRKREVGR